jgi:hypothetical protein
VFYRVTQQVVNALPLLDTERVLLGMKLAEIRITEKPAQPILLGQ